MSSPTPDDVSSATFRTDSLWCSSLHHPFRAAQPVKPSALAGVFILTILILIGDQI
jgi:hypothetical protein